MPHSSPPDPASAAPASTPTSTPAGTRRRAALGVLDALTMLILVVTGTQGLARTLPRKGPMPTAPPIQVDPGHDPPHRLVWLPGIGAGRAASIVEDRERHGPYPSLDALTRVAGIGPATVAGLRAVQTVRVSLQSAPVSLESAPASLESAPASLESAPASLESAPASLESAPASLESAPASLESAPASLESAPGAPAGSR